MLDSSLHAGHRIASFVARTAFAALISGLGLGLGLACAASVAPTTPILVFETGMHTGKPKGIDVDFAGRWAVTAAYDHSARVWEVDTGRAAAVLRPPQYQNGTVNAASISPDASEVAVAAWSGAKDSAAYVYFFDRTSGALLRRSIALPEIVGAMSYSPDGRWVAVALLGDNGVRLIDAATGLLAGSDSAYDKEAYSVHFNAGATRLVTTSHDGQVRLYSVGKRNLRLLRASRVDMGRRLFAARFSPDGRSIAVGSNDSGYLLILDSVTLAETARLQADDQRNFVAVAWSADGRRLIAGGNPGTGAPARLWSASDWTRGEDVPIQTTSLSSLRALPVEAGGGWVFYGHGPIWGVLDGRGKVVHSRAADTGILGYPTHQLLISPDGTRVGFGLGPAQTDARIFDVAERRLTVGPAIDASGVPLAPPRTSAPGMEITGLPSTQVKLNGERLQLSDSNDSGRAVAVAPDLKRFVIASQFGVALYDHKGNKEWSTDSHSPGRVVNVSGNGRFVVVGFEDSTLRWYTMDKGEEVLSLFVHPDMARWVVWTREGFFDAAEGAEEMIGYHVNRGEDRAADFISARQLRDIYLQPALISRRLTEGGDALVAQAGSRLGSVDRLLRDARNIPPDVELISESVLAGETEVTLRLRVLDRGAGVGQLKFYVDGQPMEGRQTGVVAGETLVRTFPLAPGRRIIEASATSRGGVEGARKAVVALMKGAPRGEALHILAIGVQTYRDSALQLRHSVQDAEELSAELLRLGRPLFERGVFAKVLRDSGASLQGIQSAFQELRANVEPQDTLVLFLAGHGVARDGRYAFLPWDFQRGEAGAAGEGLNEARLFQMMDQSPGNTLLLIDSCDAGGMVDLFEGAYERLGALKKRAVIGASRLGEMALEGYNGHGVFTAALLRTLRRQPEVRGDPLTVPELYGQVKKDVVRIGAEMKRAYRQSVSGYIGSADFAVVKR